MSTQQDIYVAGSENRPPMLNKENYVPWSSRLLRYAKSRPNGKFIYNSIINGPYVRRMIPELGDANREVPVPETFHEQTDDELTEVEIKQMEAGDQAIWTILLGLPKDIYAAFDSCKNAQEIWLSVQQMMKEHRESGWNVGNQNGLIVLPKIANQNLNGNVNGNVVAARAEGNAIENNGNQIRCYNCRGIAQEEESWIHYTQEEFEFMATADAYEETERVKVNCTSEDTLQQASTSGTQSDNALVYDSDGSTKVPKDENCYDHDIFNMLTHEVRYTDLQTELDRKKEKHENCIIKKEKEHAVLWNNWYIKCEECKYDKISYDKAYNDMQQKIKQLQAQLGDLKGKSSDTQCASNTPDPLLEYENISLESQTNSIIGSFQKQLYDTSFENAKLRAQLFDKVSEQKGISKGTRMNTNFTKKSILEKPPSSSFKPKLYFVTTFPKSSILPKVDKTNALSKPVTSNSAPSTRESKVLQTVNVIYPRIFRTNPSKTFRQRLVTGNHDVCVLNYVNDMNSRADNQSANVSICENQKKHKANAKKSKELGSKGSLASSRPSEPRTCLRWISTGRIFTMCGKLTASSNTENKSEKSVCDNASTSNPLKPSSKGFSNSTSLLGRYDSHDVNDRAGKSIRSFVRRIIQMDKIKLFQSLRMLLLVMHPINVNNNKFQLHQLQL
nr:hypothetical protein [Tanacetum cinerariifolium]